MKNNFVVVLNEEPIECDESFVRSNFNGIFISNFVNQNIHEKKNQLTLNIEEGDDFYEVTKDIFQGNKYEITNDNVDYLLKLSQIIKYSNLQTKLNSFCYQRECDNNQIDQHPSIQFLVELSSLIRKLSLSNYEDFSSQIKDMLVINNRNPIKKKEKSKKAKTKKSKKKKQEDEEDNNEEDKEEGKISLININKKTLSKLFYYDIINNLSSKFHTLEELKEHQNKIDLIVQLIKELDSNTEEEDRVETEEEDFDSESKTYLSNFIHYVIKKYYKIKSASTYISNYRQETFYLINYLLTNKLITIEQLQDGTEKNSISHKNWCPEYFLHHYSEKMIKNYFKTHINLILDDNSQTNESNYTRIRKSKKGAKNDDNSFDNKVKKYLKAHQKKNRTGIFLRR